MDTRRIELKRSFKHHIAAAVQRGRSSQSRHMLAANVIQQACMALLFLYLPNILSKADYAQVVYVSMLLSFFAFADAGLSRAYGRMVPSLLAQGNHGEIRLWNSTMYAFGLLASAVYSVIIALLYYLHSGNALNTLLLLPVPFITCWFSFYSNRANAHGDFSLYRRINSLRFLTSLAAIPLAIACGLAGWFIANLAAVLVALTGVGRQLLQPLGAPHWALVRRHLREGLMLSCIGALWLQLLNFARLYASVRYNAETLATYGIISAAYQSLSTLLISLFLPVSVGVMGRYGESEEKALAFTGRVIRGSLPWIAVGTVLSVIIAPAAIHICFPAYRVNTGLLVAMLLGIAFYPLLLAWNPFVVASKRFGQYLLLLVFSMASGFLFSWEVDRHYPGYGAAWGQLFGIMLYALLLFVMIARGANKQTKKAWRSEAWYLSSAYGLSAAVIGVWAIFFNT